MSEKPFVAFVGECSDFYLGHARSFASVSMQRSTHTSTHTSTDTRTVGSRARVAIAIADCLGAHLFSNNYEH